MNEQVFPLRRPYVFAVILLGIMLVVGIIAAVVVRVMELNMFVYWGATSVVQALIGALLLARLGWWRRVGFRRSERPGLHLLLWIPLCPILVWNLSQIEVTELVSIGNMLGLIVLTALAAFVEEVFFRGLMLRALEPRGLWKAAALTYLLFGAMHGFGGLAGSDFGMVAGRMVYATAIGFAYAAYALHTGLIWPLILVHALANFADLIDQETIFEASAPGNADLIRWLVYVVIFTAYGILVLRRTARSSVSRLRSHPVA